MKLSKNDTNYKHELDDLIIKILSERNECYENGLFKEIQKDGFSGSKKTFHGHLVKMTKANFIQYEKRGRKHYYSLTEHTKRRLEFEIKEYVKPKRRNLKYKKQIPKYDKKKLYALFLLQSGAGSTQIISSSSTKNQDLNESLMMIDPRYLNNNNRIKYHRQEKQKIIKDISMSMV